MTSSYDYGAIASSHNIAAQLIIFNNWTGGVFSIGIIVVLVFALFAIMKNNGQETEDAIIASCFAGFVLSAIGWAIRYNGLGLVSTPVPIIFIVLTGLFVAVKLIKKAFE